LQKFAATAEWVEGLIREQTSIPKDAKDFITKLRQKYNLRSARSNPSVVFVTTRNAKCLKLLLKV
jgi:hypothetical protein